MKLVGLTLFGVGYVLGSKAGRERYDQIRALARAAADRFDDPATQSRLSEYTDRLAAFTQPTGEISDPTVNGTGSRVNARDL